jgi:hypothetical protein
MPSPDWRAHEADVEAELGRQERKLRQQANKEALDVVCARLEAHTLWNALPRANES